MVWGAGEHGDRASLGGGAKTTRPFTHSLTQTHAHARTHGTRDARPAAALEGGEGGEKKSRCVRWPCVRLLPCCCCMQPTRRTALRPRWCYGTTSQGLWRAGSLVGLLVGVWCLFFYIYFSCTVYIAKHSKFIFVTLGSVRLMLPKSSLNKITPTPPPPTHPPTHTHTQKRK